MSQSGKNSTHRFTVDLVVRADGNAGDRTPIHSPGITIGRQDDCGLRVDDASVSRRHCEINVSEMGVRIRDLASHNGTRVNKSPIPAQQWVPLWHDDVLHVGQLEFRLSIRDSATGESIMADSPSGKSLMNPLFGLDTVELEGDLETLAAELREHQRKHDDSQ